MSRSPYNKRGLAACLALILTLATIALAAAPAANAESSLYFDGYVYYADGTTPAGGATVYIYYPADIVSPESVTTDASGYYVSAQHSLSGTEVRRYAFNERASASEVTDSFTYSPGVHVNRDFSLPPEAAYAGFSGRVTYNGNPAAGAAVHYEYGGYYGDYSCNDGGNYAFGGYFFGGPATVRVTYNGVTSDFTVTPGPFETVTHDFALMPPAAYISGYVTHDGAPVGGATVTIMYGGNTYYLTSASDGHYNRVLPYDGSQATVWATSTGLHSTEHVYTPALSEAFTVNIPMTDPAPSSTPTPAPAGTVTIYAITRINGTPTNGVQVTGQYHGLTQTQVSANLNIDDASCGASYNGPGATVFVFSTGAGDAVLHAAQGSYEGSLTVPISIPMGSSFSCFQYLNLAPAATTSGGATATPTAVPTIAANATPSAGLSATPTATGTATNVTATPVAANGITATPVDGGSNSSGGCCGTTLIFLLASVLCPVLVLMKSRKN